MEKWQLQQRQGLPLEIKIRLSQQRIKEWYEYWDGDVYVAFSGGKDSTVLLDLVRGIYPNVPAVFSDTGLEYPEVRNFVKETENVVWLKPKKSFKTIIEMCGYPVLSKELSHGIEEVRNTKSEKLRDLRLNGRVKTAKSGTKYIQGRISLKWQYLIDAPFKISPKCCDYMKKNPAKKYEKETKRVGYIGIMAGDSAFRQQRLLRTGCNAFDSKRPLSSPISFWTDLDIWQYLENKSYSNIYDLGYTHTGCMFCMFGVHLEKEPNRFQRMKETHPDKYEYCMKNLGLDEVLTYMGVNH